MKFEKIEAGMTLFDVHKERAGNTTLSTMGCWTVFVVRVDRDTNSAMVSWNGNPTERWYRFRLEKLRAKRPVFVSGVFGTKRLQTAAERKAEKESAA